MKKVLLGIMFLGMSLLLSNEDVKDERLHYGDMIYIYNAVKKSCTPLERKHSNLFMEKYKKGDAEVIARGINELGRVTLLRYKDDNDGKKYLSVFSNTYAICMSYVNDANSKEKKSDDYYLSIKDPYLSELN